MDADGFKIKFQFIPSVDRNTELHVEKAVAWQ